MNTKTKRQEAMAWWNSLSSLRKAQYCDTSTQLIGKSRQWETLTGREIQILYEDECHVESEIINKAFKNRGTQRSPFGIGS